jgi:hypothetical protein
MRRFVWTIAFLPILFLFSGCDFEPHVPVEMTSMSQSHPLGKEKSLDANIRFDIGSLEIFGEKSSAAYSVDLEYDKGSYQPELHYDPLSGGDEGRLSFKLESTHRAGIRNERHRNRLRLGLTNSVPIRINVNTGVGDARLNLSGLKVSHLDLECGVGGAKISCYDPNPVACDRIRIRNGVGSMEAVGLGNLNFHELDFEGGVGGANLDFTGKWEQDAQVRVQVGVGGVNLRMPRDVGIRVEAEKHFLSGLHLDGFSKRDGFHYSDNYDKAKTRISVQVTTGVGGFKISWI